MIFNPILPIWLMAIICVAMLVIKRKGAFAFVRQIIIVLLLFAINLRPMLPGEPIHFDKEKKISNTYVVFIVDDTLSMLADDCKENRLTQAKEDIKYIVNELDGAKFCVIEFHNDAILLSPFTDNSKHIINTVNSIYPLEYFYAHGSSLNVSKKMTIETLQRVNSEGKANVALFFISDGEMSSDVTLESFADVGEMVDTGAVLGYGTEKGGNMLYWDSLHEKNEYIINHSTGENAVSKINEDNLKQIATDMGVEYIHTDDKSKLNAILEKIKNFGFETESVMSEETIDNRKDIYYYFAYALVLIFLIEAVLLIVKKRGEL